MPIGEEKLDKDNLRNLEINRYWELDGGSNMTQFWNEILTQRGKLYGSVGLRRQWKKK